MKSRLLLLLLLAFAAVTTTAEFICDDDFDCQPHGYCANDQHCECHDGYAGAQCDIACPLDCQNGGVCQVKNEHGGLEMENEYSCACLPGFSGGLCQTTDADASSSNAVVPCPLACQNGGTCEVKNEHGGLEMENEYSCDCRPGFSGGLCQNLNTAPTLAPNDNARFPSYLQGYDEWTLEVGAIVGVTVAVLLAVVIVISYICVARKRRKLKAALAKTAEESLPRPPKDLELEEQSGDFDADMTPDDVSLPSVV